MIIDKKDKPSRPVEIDLTGPQGNVFYLMNFVNHNAKHLGLNAEGIIAQMKRGDYENAVKVFDRYFHNHVIIYK